RLNHRRYAWLAAFVLMAWACGAVNGQGPPAENARAVFDLELMSGYVFDQGLPALNRPLDPLAQQPAPTTAPQPVPFFQTPFDAPLGYSGPSGIMPREGQTDPHFVPVEDRWRIGFPEWNRYAEGTTADADAPYQLGHWWDPFKQNVLKGDYPIIGQHTFFVLTAASVTLVQPRQVPIGTTAFESTARPFEAEFFGRPNHDVFSQNFVLGLEMFHGDTAFRPVDWRIKATPVFNFNFVDFEELAVVNPDVRRGSERARSYLALQEWFVEKKIADLSPNYDFVSIRAGAQPFVNDFRGFIFSDTNRAVRIFGNLDSNREQFNLAYFRQLEKDTNSELNTFHERHQQVLIGNYYVQDFIFPGYTAQWNIVYNHDDPTFKYDNNSFLVRPDPVGVFQPHTLDVLYFGWTGDGHIDRFNINHATYFACGRDSLNPIANQGQDISAWMGALELSYDRDWVRFRTSAFYASGDENPRNGHATGFDSVMDNPNFAGGEFSYWQRQAIRLFGVNLTNQQSLVPDLRSSKIQGQSNFVNPGLILLNAGVDFDVTPKLRLINNINFLWFDNVETLRVYTFQQKIDSFIGIDLSMGVEYRPFLNNNVIVTAGVSSLVAGAGFRDLYSNSNNSIDFLAAGFVDLVLRY
ncbi:MAG TPA: hypothetical protein VE988_12815, partial [Gemmataceae bacterium]|nr:hypothetical protein [Gemmataceae bacterium]